MREPTELGRVILKRLDEVGWSLAELERNTKPPLSKNTIRHAVYGPNSPQRKTIEILARALDLPVQDLLESSEPPPRYWRFGDWLFRKENRYAWICAGGTAITGILLFLQSLGIWSLPKASVHATQAVVILILAAMLPRHRPASQALSPFREDERGKIAIASRASLDFRSLWFWAWVSWGLLYAAFAVCSFRGWLSEEPGSVPAARW